MKYDVEVLKKMIDNRTVNIKSFSALSNTEEQIAMMVKERRELAALIENDGVLDANMVRPDSMLYEANKPNADTSWWANGT